MIECRNCETAQFLQITRSYARYNTDKTGIIEVREEYRCFHCDGTGGYEYDGETETLSGDIRHTPDRPLTISGLKQGGSA